MQLEVVENTGDSVGTKNAEELEAQRILEGNDDKTFQRLASISQCQRG